MSVATPRQARSERTLEKIMAACDRANQYVESKAPWNLRKDPDKAQDKISSDREVALRDKYCK